MKSETKSVFVNSKPKKNPEDYIQGHTWFGLTAHILRHGKLVRCEIRDMVCDQTFVGIQVRWREKDKIFNKNVSAMKLITINCTWFTGDIIQSDDEDGNIHTCKKPDMLPVLALFETEKYKWTSEQLRGIAWMINETNDIRHVLTLPQE